MGLLKLLKSIQKTRVKPNFIDEDLTVEEIDKKIRELDWEEAENYIRKLSREKNHEVFKYVTKRYFDHMKEEDKKCWKEHGMSIYDYHDLEHPSCSHY